jgi:cytochrome c
MWVMTTAALRTLTASLAFSLCLSATAFAEGDAVHGEKVFSRCSTCHSIDAPRTRMGATFDGRGRQADGWSG